MLPCFTRSYDFCKDGEDRIVMNYVWKESDPVTRGDRVFTDVAKFRGRVFDVHTMPWAHYVLASPLTEEQGRTDTR